MFATKTLAPCLALLAFCTPCDSKAPSPADTKTVTLKFAKKIAPNSNEAKMLKINKPGRVELFWAPDATAGKHILRVRHKDTGKIVAAQRGGGTVRFSVTTAMVGQGSAYAFEVWNMNADTRQIKGKMTITKPK